MGERFKFDYGEWKESKDRYEIQGFFGVIKIIGFIGLLCLLVPMVAYVIALFYTINTITLIISFIISALILIKLFVVFPFMGT